MSSLVGGIGIIGQDMVCGFGNGKYKTFEGTEIAAENCVKAKVKDLRVEGKTYQNLVSNLDELVGNIYTKKNEAKVVSNLLKVSTTYTFIINISEANYSDTNFGAIMIINYPTLSTSYVNISKKNGIFKVRYTIKEEIPKNILISPHANNDTSSSFKLENLIILEGDYTNIDLPNNINGIESVSERENNVLSVKINDNTTTLNLPIPLRSLPNGTCNTIEGNKLAQRVGAVLLNGTQDMTLANVNQTLTTRVRIRMDNAKVSKNNLICNWFIRTEAHGDYEYIIIQDSSAGICLFISVLNTKLDTVDLNGIEKYFKENPLIVYYELATPIIHDLEIPSISTTKGTNVITTSNNIKPKLKLKVKVKK